MKKPVILINGGPAFDKMFESDSWGINKTYVHAVGAAGGAPVLCADDFSAEEYAQVCDGLILTGKDQRGTEEMLETAGRATGAPLLIGGGVDAQNTGQLKGRAQGFIIGSCLKTPGGPYADLSPRACIEVAEAFAKQ